MKNFFKIFLGVVSFLLVFYCNILISQTIFSSHIVDQHTKTIKLDMNLPAGDFIYKDYITISIDHPDIKLSDWNTNVEAIKHFSKSFKETKAIFDKNFIITLQASNLKGIETQQANIHLSYYLHSKNGIVEEVFPLNICRNTTIEETNDLQTYIDLEKQIVETITKPTRETLKKHQKTKTWSQHLENAVQKTESSWLRVFIAFLLGLLLSLTPCIYPMIPITVGILQSQKNKSIFYNFLLATTYVMGVAFTFSILGLISALTGQMFGSFQLLTNPIFIITLVVILVYLGLSMFDIYEIYIPKFMMHSNGPKGGSLISIFLFGIMSGTVASPCASPGLVLLLSIVATIANKLLGLAILFAFGLGLGFPLLIVGTFSGSMNVLPKAGSWMLEIKKIFGFLIFGTCLYFLKNISPWHIIVWMTTTFMLVTGIYYLVNIKSYDSKFWRFFKNFVGISCIAFSVFLAIKSYQITFYEPKPIEDALWQQDYEKAIKQAQKENKKIFLDFGSEICTICKIIDRKKLQDNKVRQQLSKLFINVKIDAIDITKEPFSSLSKKYQITTVPVYLIVDPDTEKVIKRWSSELYDMSNEEFIKKINQYI